MQNRKGGQKTVDDLCPLFGPGITAIFVFFVYAISKNTIWVSLEIGRILRPISRRAGCQAATAERLIFGLSGWAAGGLAAWWSGWLDGWMAGWLGADTACLILGHLTDTPSHPSGPLGHPTDFSGCRLISRAASQATAAGPPPGLPIHPMRCCAEYSSHCSACRLQPGWRATRDSYRALAEMGGGRAIHMVRMLVPCRFAH